jgi:hypothetical protein
VPYGSPSAGVVGDDALPGPKPLSRTSSCTLCCTCMHAQTEHHTRSAMLSMRFAASSKLQKRRRARQTH